MEIKQQSRRRLNLMRGAASLALVVGAGAPTLAVAQGTDPSDSNDEIVVIGRFQNSLVNRLPIPVQEIPFSLDIIDRDFIDERGFIRPLEALQTVPNVVVDDDSFTSGAPNFLVRGFAASILVNNRPEGASGGFGRRDNAFVERYEVLKGPASISLGPVQPGGIINTVTKLPEAEPFLDLELRGGSFGTFRSEIDVNAGSILGTDAIRFRTTFAFENAQFAADQESRQVLAVRPVFEIDLSPNTRSTFSVAYREVDAVPNLNFARFTDGTIPAAFTPETFIGPPGNVGAQATDLLIDGEVQHDFLDNLKLTLRGSYQDTSLDYQNQQGLYNYPSGGIPLPPATPVGYLYSSAGTSDDEVTYVDAQLAWNTPLLGGTLDIVVGGTYQDTVEERTFAFQESEDFISGFIFALIDVRDPMFESLPVPIVTAPFNPFDIIENRLFSVYSEAILRPFDWLTVTGGVRFDDLETAIVDPTVGGDDLNMDDEVQDTVDNTDDVSFRIGATAEITDSINFYASFAESFIPQTGRIDENTPVGPETAVSYEVGLKAQLFDNRVTINTALFNTLRQNVAQVRPAAFGENPLGFVIPVGEQRHRGFELSANGELISGWNLFVSYGYLDAEFTVDTSEPDLTGLRATLAPEHTFSAFSSYTFQEGPLENFQLGAGVRYLSDRPGPIGSDGFTNGGYTLMDAFASYRFNEDVRIQVNANNVLDEEYLESTGNGGGVRGGAAFGPPRTILFTLNVRF